MIHDEIANCLMNPEEAIRLDALKKVCMHTTSFLASLSHTHSHTLSRFLPPSLSLPSSLHERCPWLTISLAAAWKVRMIDSL
jgi:hypothetical protein